MGLVQGVVIAHQQIAQVIVQLVIVGHLDGLQLLCSLSEDLLDPQAGVCVRHGLLLLCGYDATKASTVCLCIHVLVLLPPALLPTLILISVAVERVGGFAVLSHLLRNKLINFSTFIYYNIFHIYQILQLKSITLLDKCIIYQDLALVQTNEHKKMFFPIE